MYHIYVLWCRTVSNPAFLGLALLFHPGTASALGNLKVADLAEGGFDTGSANSLVIHMHQMVK
jgi:hypothetical protein